LKPRAHFGIVWSAVLLALPACSADTPAPAPARPTAERVEAPTPPASAAPPAGGNAAASAATEASSAACAAGERTVFACRSGAKDIALCEGPGAALQYRFGKPGSPPEMIYPGPGEGSPAFSAGAATLAGGGGAWVEFTRPPYRYVVFSFWLQGKGETAGVAVEQGGKRLATLRCDAAARSELGADYFGAAHLPASNSDFLP